MRWREIEREGRRERDHSLAIERERGGMEEGARPLTGVRESEREGRRERDHSLAIEKKKRERERRG